MSFPTLEEFRLSHARILQRLYVKARPERWELSEADFAAAIHRSAVGRFARQTTDEAQDLTPYLDSLQVEDLALAASCERGNQVAWVDFLGRFRQTLLASARALVRDEARARETADALYAELYGLEERDGQRRSLFQYFHGRSSLATWLRAVVARSVVDGYRASRRSAAMRERVEKEGEIGRTAIAETIDEPERDRYLALLRTSLVKEISQLERRDRLRLAYYHVQQLTLAEVGRLLSEHESTVSRRLEQTRKALRKGIERSLRREHRLATDQIHACYEAALKSFPFDLTAELGEET